MVTHTYSPFTDLHGNPKTIFEIEFADLLQIQTKDIEEGPYIEFKRELSSSVKNKIPNFITSFANEQGGWFFIGIDEDNKEICCIEKAEYELQINNVLKSNTSPVPKIITRFLVSDEDSTKGVFVIYIPQGENPPYISKGKVYRRVGSGSSPLDEVKDRYFLDKLYEKSEVHRNNLLKFCRKEISIYNHFLNKPSGMCNIYLIPTFKFSTFDNLSGDIKNPFINLALETANKEFKYDLAAGGHITLSIPFEKATFSHESIVFRNSKLLENYENTIAWEQFVDGSAKFHIPVPYLKDDSIINVIQACTKDYNEKHIFDSFNYADGKNFITSILGCLSTYLQTMKKVNENFSEIIVAIELENVRRDVLFFNTEAFNKQVQEKGLSFSDRDYYFLNQKFQSKKVDTNNLSGLLKLFYEIYNAFGLSIKDGLDFLFKSQKEAKSSL